MEVKCNSLLPRMGKKRRKGETSRGTTSVKPANQGNLAGNLFYAACREEISTKKSINLHFKSVTHQQGKERLSPKEKREQGIVAAVKCYPAPIRRVPS